MQALLTCFVVVMVMIIFSGYAFPVDTMPPFMQSISNIFPLKHWLIIFRGILLKGAGIQAATMVHDRGAEVLMTGYCGPKAFQTLQAAGVKVVSDVGGSVNEALERLRSGEVEYLEKANADGHW